MGVPASTVSWRRPFAQAYAPLLRRPSGGCPGAGTAPAVEPPKLHGVRPSCAALSQAPRWGRCSRPGSQAIRLDQRCEVPSPLQAPCVFSRRAVTTRSRSGLLSGGPRGGRCERSGPPGPGSACRADPLGRPILRTDAEARPPGIPDSLGRTSIRQGPGMLAWKLRGTSGPEGGRLGVPARACPCRIPCLRGDPGAQGPDRQAGDRRKRRFCADPATIGAGGLTEPIQAGILASEQ